MREIFVLSIILLVATGLSSGACAQEIKTKQFTNSQAKIVETPYVTRTGLQDIRLSTPSGAVRLGQIMRVASIDEATDLLGRPDSTIIDKIGVGAYERSILLVYEGMEVTFMDAAGKIQLEKFHIDARSYSLQIGEKRIRPGMPSSQLGRVLRKSPTSDDRDTTRSHTIRISEETPTKKGREGSKIAEHEAISIKVDKSTGRIIKVRYYRLI